MFEKATPPRLYFRLRRTTDVKTTVTKQFVLQAIEWQRLGLWVVVGSRTMASFTSLTTK